MKLIDRVITVITSVAVGLIFAVVVVCAVWRVVAILAEVCT